jgi:transposase InsO family protein
VPGARSAALDPAASQAAFGGRRGLTTAIIRLASVYGRYRYRRVTALLQQEGWRVNHKRVERIWRREGLKVPRRQPRRGRLWLADGSCARHRPTPRHHVWASDVLAVRAQNGRRLRLLTIVDEYTRECLAIEVARRLRADDVLHRLAAPFVQRGAPGYFRSDNGPEVPARAVRQWLGRVGVRTL